MSGSNLANLFGLRDIKEPLPEKKEEHLGLDADADEARANLKVLIETGNRALEEMLNLAIDSEEPRAYEVLSNMIASLAELNLKTLEAHNKQADVKKKSLTNKNDPGGQPTVNGNVTNQSIVFTGTTSELAGFLQTLKNQNEVQDAKVINNE